MGTNTFDCERQNASKTPAPFDLYEPWLRAAYFPIRFAASLATAGCSVEPCRAASPDASDVPENRPNYGGLAKKNWQNFDFLPWVRGV